MRIMASRVSAIQPCASPSDNVVLLFQAPRSTQELDIGIDEMNSLLRPLITALRRLAQISDLIDLLVSTTLHHVAAQSHDQYPEAVNRMIRKGYVKELTNEDIVAVLRCISATTLFVLLADMIPGECIR
jgi:hypothetical protein